MDPGEGCDDGKNGDDCDGCTDECQEFVNVCGDGVVCGDEECDDGGNGDVCDGCTDECQEFVNVCGDGVRCDDEMCDGEDLGGAVCADLGTYTGGSLSCTAECTFETDACFECGDGVCQGGETPADCPEECGWSAVDGGSNHTCAVRNDGTLWCWGYNAFGQLGDGTHNSSSSPVFIDVLGASMGGVVGGSAHTCGFTVTGEVYCWGNNDSHQI